MAICNKCLRYFDTDDYSNDDDRNDEICPDCTYLGYEEPEDMDPVIHQPPETLIPRAVGEAKLNGEIDNDEDIEFDDDDDGELDDASLEDDDNDEYTE